MKACGHRVIVKPYKLEEHDEVYKAAKKAGLEFAASKELKREEQGVDRGVVVQIGSTAWLTDVLGGVPWCSVGDTILFAKHAGKRFEVPSTKEEFVIINDEDVVLVYEKEDLENE